MLRTLLFLACLGASTAAIASDAVTSDQTKRIAADVMAILHDSTAPGASIAIAKDGHIVYSHAYGLRNREQRLPATVDTHYEIGSITKQFTAAAILQLQEEGKLRIDDKVATYLPDAPHAAEVTLRQLLSHTSGLPEYLDAMDADHMIGKPASFDQLMAHIAGKPLDFAPGSHWAYSNTGYAMLGRIIELLSHESFRHYVQNHLLDPAGMTQTFTVGDETHLPDMALGYSRENGRIERAGTISDSVGGPAGFLVSTVGDLQKWNLALQGGRIVTPADYALMGTSVKTTDDGDAGYGFGLFIDTINGQPRIGHTGGSLGFTTANEFYPKQGVQIIAFTNGKDDPEPGERITTAVFEELYPELAVAAARPAAGEDVAATAAAKAVFLQWQRGEPDVAQLSAKLAAKMQAGLAKRLGDHLLPYGQPSAFVFRGKRTEGKRRWSDYVIYFGPGSRLKFSLGLDADGKVASLSVG